MSLYLIIPLLAIVVVWLLNHSWYFFDPLDYSQPVSSARGIFQARILEWLAISHSRGSSWPRNRTRISCKSLALQAFSLPLSHQGSPSWKDTITQIRFLKISSFPQEGWRHPCSSLCCLHSVSLIFQQGQVQCTRIIFSWK